MCYLKVAAPQVISQEILSSSHNRLYQRYGVQLPFGGYIRGHGFFQLPKFCWHWKFSSSILLAKLGGDQ